jgi:transcriptional regulator with GAF, ATPase, and Fis domain
VLQEQEFERVGGSRTLRVDVRIIAATNRNLADAVQAGAFRSDLYYRLNVFPLLLPPLRERAEDIPLLAAHFLERSMRRLGKSFKGIEPESMNRLRRYHWPGNIRELQNIIERAAILSAGETLVIQESLAPPAGGVAPGAVDLRTLEQIEDAHIRQVLQQTEWVIEGKRGAAIILGLEPSTLRYRMQKLGIKRPTPG